MQYFFSFLPCLLKVNGKLEGLISTEPKGLPLKEGDFIEFLSPDCNYLPLGFLLKSPPPQVRRLTSIFGDFIYPLSFTPYPIFCEETLVYSHSKATVKLVCQALCNLVISTPNCQITEILPSKPSSIKVLFLENGYIGLLLQLNRPSIYIFEMANGKKMLTFQADEICYDGCVLSCKSFVPSILQHTVYTDFSSDGKNIKITRAKSLDQLSELQLKYAFLECVCLKDKVSDFLADIEPYSFLSFIGDFECIMPSLSPNHDFSLIGKNLKFIKLEIENRKITNAIID